jgi:hypothetical protein
LTIAHQQRGEQQMPIIHRWNRFLLAMLLALPTALAVGHSAPVPSAADLAQRQVVAYVAKLAELHCTESVTQEKLAPNGHVEASERAKYDYLIMIDGNGDDFQLNESRIESSASRHKQLPMLVTNGFSTVLLVFHPYYHDSFTFITGADEMVNGKPAIPVHFAQLPAHRAPAALALRGHEYPLELEGTAWLDKKSGDVVKMDASLLHDMSDIDLRSLHVHVEYKPVNLGRNMTDISLPVLAIVDVTTPRQHWRNTHVFDSYKSFSTETIQNPDVKIHTDKATAGNDNSATLDPQGQKEKH